MYKMKINDMEMVEIQTHIKLVNKDYVKMQQQRSVVENMDQEFQEFFKELVNRKGGDPEKEYQLDLENKTIIEAQGQTSPEVANNGSQPDNSSLSPIKEELEFEVEKV